MLKALETVLSSSKRTDGDTALKEDEERDAVAETGPLSLASGPILSSDIIEANWQHWFGDAPGVVVLPVIHVMRPASYDKVDAEVWEQIESNIKIVRDCGLHGVFLINHGFRGDSLVPYLRKARKQYPSLFIGVNFLGAMGSGVEVLKAYKLFDVVSGLWADNGGIREGVAATSAMRSAQLMKDQHWSGLYFGGVDFKGQKQISRHYAESDEDYVKQVAKLSSAACEAGVMHVVCTSGKGTGRAAPLDKMKAFRQGRDEVLDKCSARLAVASGVTPDNVASYLPFVDAILVATGVSSDFHHFSLDKMEALAKIVHEHNSSLGSAGAASSAATAEDEKKDDGDETE